jgi:hypothetical protein
MAATAALNGSIVHVGEVSNDAEDSITIQQPYLVEFTLEGTADILFHRWSNEDVAAKGSAGKNTKQKKTDNLEAYVYRLDNGHLALPGEYVRMAMIYAAKFRQDPRSPRKSAMDLYKASIIPMTPLADLGVKTWDYEDRRRVVIQRAGITRTRPALKTGWTASFQFQVLTPEYISPQDFYDVLRQAGLLIGLADFRPTYGRFNITRFERMILI